MIAQKYTCSKCNAIKIPGKACKPCAAQYMKHYYRTKVKGAVAVRPVFKRTRFIKTGRFVEIFDALSGQLLHSGLYATAQEAYEALLLRRGHSPMDENYCDSWIDDSSVYVRVRTI